MFIEKVILLCKWKYYSLLGAWIQTPLLPQQATKAVNCLLIPGERFLKFLDSFCFLLMFVLLLLLQVYLCARFIFDDSKSRLFVDIIIMWVFRVFLLFFFKFIFGRC